MKFLPMPPTPENSGTCIPLGAISTAVRSESGENAAVSETVMSAIVKVPPKLGTVTVESSSPEIVLTRLGDVRWEELWPADGPRRAHDRQHVGRR